MIKIDVCGEVAFETTVKPTSLNNIKLELSCGETLVGGRIVYGARIKAKHVDSSGSESAIVAMDSIDNLVTVPEPGIILMIIFGVAGLMVIEFIRRLRDK